MKKFLVSESLSRKYDKKYFDKTLGKYTDQYLHEVSKSGALSEYSVIFDSIFASEDMFQSFWRHLEYEYTTESLEFLLDLDSFLRECATEINVAGLAALYEKYIQTGVSRELNLSHHSKQQLQTKLKDQLQQKEWTLTESPYEIFEPLQKSILLELKMGTFPRFVRKNLCQLIVTALNYPENIVSLKKNQEFPYTDAEFGFPLVTDKDVAFMKSIMMDSFDWELVASAKDMNAFWCDKHYMNGVTYYSTAPAVLRVELMLPFPMQRVAAMFLSTKECEQFDPRTTRMVFGKEYDHEACKEEMKKKEYDFSTENGKRSCMMAEQHIKLPFPFTTPRKMLGTHTIDFDPETKTLLKVGRSVLEPATKTWNKPTKQNVFMSKESKKEVRTNCYTTIDFVGHHIQRIDENTTFYKQCHVMNPHGYAANLKLQRLVCRKVGPIMQKNLLDHLPKLKCNTWDEVIDFLKGDPIGKMLREMDITNTLITYDKRASEGEEGKKVETLTIGDKESLIPTESIIPLINIEHSSPVEEKKEDTKRLLNTPENSGMDSGDVHVLDAEKNDVSEGGDISIQTKFDSMTDSNILDNQPPSATDTEKLISPE